MNFKKYLIYVHTNLEGMSSNYSGRLPKIYYREFPWKSNVVWSCDLMRLVEVCAASPYNHKYWKETKYLTGPYIFNFVSNRSLNFKIVK